MKQKYQKKSIQIIFATAMMILSGTLNAQLSGTYTINPTLSASSSNYQNWASAVSDLLSGSRSDGGSTNGPGISASVTFTVYDTIYSSTSIELTSITGSNPSRRITFKSASGKSAKCLVQNPSSTSSTNDFVLNVNGADYITFQNIGFQRTGTADYSTVVQIGNDANNVIFNGCLMQGKKGPSSSSNGFNYTIGTCFYIYGNADSTIVQNSRLLYGYNGVYCVSGCTNNLFSNNVIDSSGSSGIYMTSQTNLVIADNTFNMGDFGANLGHYTSYGMRIESSPSMQITRNKIYMSAVNGQVVRGLIIASTTSTASAPTMVSNNWIVNSGGSGDCTGFAVYACYYINFYFNNILITSPLTNSSAYYHYPQYTNTNIRLVNNNLINKGAGYTYNVSGTNTSDIDSLDYNNIYSSGSYLANWAGTNYSSLSSLRSASSKDANSINIDPGYISNRDLHVSNIGLNGKAMKYPWIPIDIDSELRDTATPDIGADEFFPIANDAGITSVDSPLVFCPGVHNIKVKFQNFGIDTIKSVQINWQINGNNQTSYSWSGSVAPGASSASIPLGSYNFSADLAYTFRVWTVNPNGVGDGKKINDTISVTRYPGMSGTYRISDSLNGDFKSFNAAIAAFTARGICGPIKFLVAPGVYNEQITLLELPGMGASNPITFEGMIKDSTKVLVTLPSTAATGNNNAAIQLRGADYIKFKYLSFERTGLNTYANVVHILNGSNNNGFYNCRMLGINLTLANTNAQNIWSDQSQDNNNEFINNNIKYGYNNILYTGVNTSHETGTIIRGNVFDSAYNSNVQILYNDGIDVSANTFLHVLVPATGNYSMQLNDCDYGISVNGNKFYNQGLESSISLTNCNAASNTPGIISNNMFSKGSGTGISLDAVDYQNVVFNSMNFTQANSGNYGIYVTASTNSAIAFKNNIISMEGGQAFFVPSASQIVASDYNDLIIKGGSFAYWGGTYNTLTDLRMASGKDGNSKTVNPFFKSATDLHIFNPLLKGSGVAFPGVTTDFDGETRNSTNPDIGADEFKLMDVDAGIADITKPLTSTCAGVDTIEVVIKNYGNDTMKTADINWTVQNNLQTVYHWTGALATNETDTVVIGTYNFIGNLNPKFAIWTTVPNGKTDLIPFNDSLIMNKSVRSLPVANAGQDFSICKGDLAIIGSTAVNGNAYQWSDLGGNTIGSSAKLTINPSASSTYVLEVTNTTFGCKKSDTVTVSVNPVPIANAGADQTICYGNSVQIGAAGQSGFSYDWSSSVGAFSSSVANPVVSPLQSTNYFLTKTIDSSGCYAADTVRVTVAFPPTPSISGTGSGCQNDELIYMVQSVSGNTYDWSVTGGQITGGQNTNSISVKWDVPGNSKVEVIQSNQASCKDTVSYNVTVFKLPVAKFEVEEHCEGGFTYFTDSSKDANTYMWDFGDGKNSTLVNPIHSYDSVKNYNVQLIVTSANNCMDTAYGAATVFPIPAANFDFNKTAGLTFSFSDMSTIQSGNITQYDWNFGDGDTSTSENPTHMYQYALLGQNLTIQLCVSSDKGCSSCFSKVLTVTSVKQLKTGGNLKLYPNPNSGLFTLESTDLIDQVEVINSIGQTVAVLKLNNQKSEIDLSGYADGVYSLKVSSNGEINVMSLIIKH